MSKKKDRKGLMGFLNDLKDKAKKSPFLVLLPYKKLMQKKLKKKGITPKNDIKELAIQFYNEFVKRRNYDEYGMEIPYTDITVNHADPPVPPEVVSQMIPAIINLLKNLISNIKSGKETDPELREAAENAEREIKKIEKKLKDEGTGGTGTAKWLIPVVAGIVALILVFVLMKRR